MIQLPHNRLLGVNKPIDAILQAGFLVFVDRGAADLGSNAFCPTHISQIVDIYNDFLVVVSLFFFTFFERRMGRYLFGILPSAARFA